MSGKDRSLQQLSSNAISAKELARSLGLVKKTMPSSTSRKKAQREINQRQYFAYLIVLDFESTCWKDKKLNYGPEIIEFPAVLLNTSTGELESEFRMFVQPIEHTKLSEFCRELTGITQAQVDDGVPIGTCLMLFGRWLQEMKDKRGFKFPCEQVQKIDQENNMESLDKWCTFVTWSDWDLGTCLKNECNRKQLRMPQPLRSWIDLRATYRNFYSRKPQGLAGALQDLGIKFSGREHSGMDDARNTARLAWRMISDGCIMHITKSIDGMLEKLWEIVSQSVDSQRDSSRKENILNGYNDKILGSGVRGYPREELTAVKDKDKVMKIRQKQAQTNEKRRAVTAVPGLKRRALQDIACTTSICVSPESSAGCNSVPKSLITPLTCLSSLSKRARECYGDFRRETPKSSTTGLLLKKGLEKQTLTDKTHTALGCSNNNHVSRTGIGQSKSITGNQLCKPSNIEPSPVMTPTVRLRVNPTSVIDGQKQKQDLTKDTDSVTYTLDSRTAVSQKAETLATPTYYSMRLGKPFTAHMGNPRPFTPPVVSFNGGGVTPPLCQCGRRTRRRCVVNPGPNQRAFFTCSFNHGRSGLGSNVGKNKSESGCKFFRWEVRS